MVPTIVVAMGLADPSAEIVRRVGGALTAADEHVRGKSMPTGGTGNTPMRGQKGFSEWQVSSQRVGNTLLHQEAARRAQGGELSTQLAESAVRKRAGSDAGSNAKVQSVCAPPSRP